MFGIAKGTPQGKFVVIIEAWPWLSVSTPLFIHFLFPDPNASESLRYSTQAEYLGH